MKKGLLAASVVMLICLAGCYNDKYDQIYVTPSNVVCDTTAVSYAATIAPILSANCNITSSCHTTAGSAISHYDLTTYAGMAQVASYNFIITDINGDPTRSHTSMPLDLPKISQCDINQITAWVNQGAKNN